MAFSSLGFSKKELIIVSSALTFIIISTLLNLQTSLRKARDAQRKSDIRSIYDALMLYNKDNGTYPLNSPDGRMLACRPHYEGEAVFYEPCDWYRDNLESYLTPILGDPRQGQGFSYYYLSNGKHFQVYASLESESEDEFEPSIARLSLPCGQKICNFGRSDGATPLDKSLEEYENELKEKNKN